jgi:hypothetical protein
MGVQLFVKVGVETLSSEEGCDTAQKRANGVCRLGWPGWGWIWRHEQFLFIS